MPVKKRGGQSLSSSFAKASGQIRKNAIRFTETVVSIAASEAMYYTPREYGTLANSQFTRVDASLSKVTGTLGYGASYAVYLNGLPGFNEPSWSPRPINEKDGPATNMNAKPHFLEEGFESERAVQSIKDAEDVFKI